MWTKSLSYGVLSLIQGITEVLPVSSSAHLFLLAPFITAHPGVEVGLHVGTLGALLLRFKPEVTQCFRGAFQCMMGRLHIPAAQLVLKLACTALVAIGIGGILHYWKPGPSGPRVIALNSLIFGLLLYGVDRYSPQRDPPIYSTQPHALPWRVVLYLALGQSFALIPGVSRLGITITAGRLGGLARQDALYFGYLTALPTIAGAVSLTAPSIFHEILLYPPFLVYLGLSGLITWWLIPRFIRWGTRYGFSSIAVYRVILGITALGLSLFP